MVPRVRRRHDTGVKAVRHPLVGEVTFTYESMELVADPGLTMFVYTTEPGSKSEQALNLLADLERLFHGHGLASNERWFVQVIEPNLAGATATAEHWYELLTSR